MLGRLVLVSLLVAVSACGGAETSSPSTTSPPPTTVQTEAATTTTTAPTTTTTEATTTMTRGFGSSTFAAPFTFDGPIVGLELESRAGDQGVFFTSGNNRWVIFSTTGPSTIEEWSQRLSRKGTVTEPEASTVGGVSAASVDASLDGLVSVFTPDGIQAPEFLAEAGDRLRLYLVDVNGVAVKVFVLASADDFDGWLTEVGSILEELVWG